MNSSQIHLALTHVPVILSLTGLVLLVLTFIKNNSNFIRPALYLLVAAGVFALPVFFTGEGAEEMVEKFPGVSETIMEEHEGLAKAALIVVLLAALTSLGALIYQNKKAFFLPLRFVVLILACSSAAVMAQTAHLGGQIRHSEIRGSVAAELNNNNQEVPGDNQSEKEDDDD
jgi:uncharacterized membrane protein